MSKLKVNAQHGGRGPAPKTFERWAASVNKRGAKRFRVHLGDGTEKLVAHKNAPDSARRIGAMHPLRVEALDDKDAELGEWIFPEEAEEAETEPEPGYLKEDDDNETERLLKTFAHLLADAHRQANRQLVETVSIQSRNFAEERKNLLQMQLVSERLLAKRLRGLGPRVRVADPDEDGEEGEEGTDGAEGGNDGFLQEMLAPILHKMVAKHMAESTGGAVNGATNGGGGDKESKP